MRRVSCRFVLFVCLLSVGMAAGADWSDPTRPDSFEAPAAAETRRAVYTVSAILTSEKRRVAIVNGQKVRVGDLVDGATVVAIDRKAVRLDVDGRNIVTAVRGNDDQ